MGSPTPGATWHLAEGSTAPPFNEVIAIVNPNGQDATATIEFELETVSTITRSFIVQAQSKLSLNIDQILLASAVSALIHQLDSDSRRADHVHRQAGQRGSNRRHRDTVG
ncbi:MAG: hypothetical protein Q8R28_11595 [Dehalococcoidia bacterium]|nr:hypothetical protein [Dehalococcoidia bacterium]